MNDPLDCPACGADPTAPHNGKGLCPPLTGQEARDDESEVHRVIAKTLSEYRWASLSVQAEQVTRRLDAAGYRKHPEPEITDDALAEARAAVAELDAAHAADPYSTNRSWDAIKRCVRALRAVAGRVPVGEVEQG